MLKRVSSYNKTKLWNSKSPYNYTTELQFVFLFTTTPHHTSLQAPTRGYLHPDTRALVPKVTQNRPRIMENYGDKNFTVRLAPCPFLLNSQPRKKFWWTLQHRYFVSGPEEKCINHGQNFHFHVWVKYSRIVTSIDEHYTPERRSQLQRCDFLRVRHRSGALALTIVAVEKR